MRSVDFDRRLERLQKESGRSRILTATELLHEWSSFVASVEQGYDMGIDEYFNDMAVRRAIDVALGDPELSQTAELAAFRRDVSALDDRFRAALLDGVFIGDEDLPWWERGVPKHARDQLAEDLHLMYGIRVPE